MQSVFSLAARRTCPAKDASKVEAAPVS